MEKKLTIKKETENLCLNCKYFTVCGDPERTEPCNGKRSSKTVQVKNLQFSWYFNLCRVFRNQNGNARSLH